MDEPTSRPHATAHDTDAHDTDAVRRLDRRLFQARAAIAWEEFWRAIWPVIALGGLFLVIAFLDALPRLDAWLHALLLASFAAAAVVVGVLTLRRLRWPDASRAGRRLETESGLRHRPLAVLADRQAGGVEDPASAALWRAHRARAAAALGALRAGWPRPHLAPAIRSPCAR